MNMLWINNSWEDLGRVWEQGGRVNGGDKRETSIIFLTIKVIFLSEHVKDII